MSDTHFVYHPKNPPRVIRVFVSSTFKDMQMEREELVKRIFPQLRKMCEERGVTWGEVDLRWGVTDEQKAEGKVLPICLEEIRRCRPYFIALLGERYGWVPEQIDPELVSQEKWLGENSQKSVTELEIIHGVLNDPTIANYSFFYFRNSKYIDTLDPSLQLNYLERPGEDEIKLYGKIQAEERARGRRLKLEALKHRIRESRMKVREDYPDPKTLGQLVLQDMGKVINALYSLEKPASPLDQEAEEHENFALSRIPVELTPGQSWGVYIGKQAYLDRLDAHTREDSPPLVIKGESGLGKTALLAYWTVQYRQNHPDELVVMHFIGVTPNSSDITAMLVRFIGELKRFFSLPGEIPTNLDWIRQYFSDTLKVAAGKGRCVLVIDGLNQLEDREGALELSWLPQEIPSNIRLILSTLPGTSQAEIDRPGWQELQVLPLDVSERKELIKKYLAQYSKTLSDSLSEQVAIAAQTANPLFLRVLLDELRLYGDHTTLLHRIQHYLTASTVTELYTKVLERYEIDYDQDRPWLVRDAFTFIWAARRGLAEAELLELLGMVNNPLPDAFWAPLHLAADQALVSRSGFLGFSHDYIRQAVEKRYLPTEQERRDIHRRLVDYFYTRAQGPRRTDELPWQLAKANEFSRLYALLEDLPFFALAYNANKIDVLRYWALVEASTHLRLLDAYQGPIGAPGNYNYNDLWSLAILLDNAGYPAEAIQLRNFLLTRSQDPFGQASLINFQIESFLKKNQLNEAMELSKQEEHLGRSIGSQIHVAASLAQQGEILYLQKRYNEGLELYEKALRIFDEIHNVNGRMNTLGLKALIKRDQGFLDEALRLHQEEESLARQHNNIEVVNNSRTNQAIILSMQYRLDEALSIWEDQLKTARELGKTNDIASCLSNKAMALKKMGRTSEIVPVAEEAYKLAKERGMDRLLTEIEPILQDIRKAADPTNTENYFLCYAPLQENPALNKTFAKAWAMAEEDHLQEAIAILNQAEQSCFQIKDIRGAINAARNRASLYGRGGIDRARSGDIPGAIALLDTGEKIYRLVDDKESLNAYLTGKALIMAGMGKPVEWLINEVDRLLIELEPNELTERIKVALDKMRQSSNTAG